MPFFLRNLSTASNWRRSTRPTARTRLGVAAPRRRHTGRRRRRRCGRRSARPRRAASAPPAVASSSPAAAAWRPRIAVALRTAAAGARARARRADGRDEAARQRGRGGSAVRRLLPVRRGWEDISLDDMAEPDSRLARVPRAGWSTPGPRCDGAGSGPGETASAGPSGGMDMATQCLAAPRKFPNYDTSTCTISEGAITWTRRFSFGWLVGTRPRRIRPHSTWDVGDVTYWQSFYSRTSMTTSRTGMSSSATNNARTVCFRARERRQDLSNWDISSVTDMNKCSKRPPPSTSTLLAQSQHGIARRCWRFLSNYSAGGVKSAVTELTTRTAQVIVNRGKNLWLLHVRRVQRRDRPSLLTAP